MRILSWNVEWATLKNQRGQEIQRIYRDLSPDVACITEGYLQFWQEEGHVIHDYLLFKLRLLQK